MDGMTEHLSDDEDIGNNVQLLESLRKGALPAELRFLYGLALLGEGNRNFLAMNCIKSIHELEQESSLWLSDQGMKNRTLRSVHWDLFRRAMTEPLGRSSAHAFLADVLRKRNKESEWAVIFAPLFQEHLRNLQDAGLVNELMRLRDVQGSYVVFRKNQLLKIMLAASRFDVDMARRDQILHPWQRIDYSTTAEIL